MPLTEQQEQRIKEIAEKYYHYHVDPVSQRRNLESALREFAAGEKVSDEEREDWLDEHYPVENGTIWLRQAVRDYQKWLRDRVSPSQKKGEEQK